MRIVVGVLVCSSVGGVLVACGSAPATPATPVDQKLAQVADAREPGSQPAVTMDSFELAGYELTGGEYWPYVGTDDIKYPEEVLWGFYPEKGKVPPGESEPNPATATPEVVACASRAWSELRAFVAGPHPKLDRIVEIGVKNGTMVPRFYLWTNDYSKAADPYPPGMREARLWWWARKTPEPPKPPGYWKWESVLDQKGVCHTPRPEQIEAYLAEKLAEMEKTQAASR